MKKEEFRLESAHKPEIDIGGSRIGLNFICSYKELNSSTIPVVVLGGFGEYADSDYMNSLYKTFEDKNILIISVDYIGIYSKIFIPPKKLKSKKYTDNIERAVIFEPENIQFLVKNLIEIYKRADEVETLLKKQKYLREDICLRDKLPQIASLLDYLSTTKSLDLNFVIKKFLEIGFIRLLTNGITKVKGDYQDFGLIQAIDVLSAVKFLKDRYPDIDWKRLSIVGSSHGAYVAQMVSKLAPNSVAKVVNNASWIKPIESEIINSQNAGGLVDIDGLWVNLINYKFWSNRVGDKNCYSVDREFIRDISRHIREQRAQTRDGNLPKYIFIHSLNDKFIPIKFKDSVVDSFESENFNVEYIRLDSEDKLDGKTFKELSHGSKASLKGLIYDFILEDEIEPIEIDDFELKSKIEYKCESGKYIIDFSSEDYPKVNFEKYLKS